MTYKTMAALRRALVKADLAHVATETADGTRTVAVAPDGTWHTIWCSRGKQAPHEQPTYAALLEHDMFDARCTCEQSMTSSVASTPVGQLLASFAVAASAQRRAARAVAANSAAGATSKALNDLRHQLRMLDILATRGLPAEHVARVRELVHAALDALAAGTVSTAARAAVLARVRRELLPRGMGGLELDDGDHLIAIYPAMRGTHTTREVIDTLRVDAPTSRQVLCAPRWIADYLYREMYRSNESTLLLSVDVRDIDEQTRRTAVSLWDPATGGHLRSLATALQVARDTLVDPAA